MEVPLNHPFLKDFPLHVEILQPLGNPRVATLQIIACNCAKSKAFAPLRLGMPTQRLSTCTLLKSVSAKRNEWQMVRRTQA
jgi:hypothetical protein